MRTMRWGKGGLFEGLSSQDQFADLQIRETHRVYGQSIVTQGLF